MSTHTHTSASGCKFLTHSITPDQVFTPEDFSEEQLAILEMCRDFVATEVMPVLDRLDKMEPGLMPGLLEKAGELGLLGAGLSERYGGMGLDVVTSMLVQQGLGHSHSFATAFAAHTGIGTYPIQYFGSEAQKTTYLPGLASGEIKPCYNLTEPNAGSDAMSGKTTATLSPDGKHYLLNGQKCWITNSGFSDLFVVFAKVDGDKMTCFLVPSNTPGLSLGEEEQKMGIKGSSTRQVFYADVKVPIENVVGEIGRGHKIAFNALNVGRIKLALAALGAAQHAHKLAIDYAAERTQFGTEIKNFGAIRYKLAEMAIRCFALESASYRCANDIEQKEQELLNAGMSENEALLGAAEEFAAECAYLKLYGADVQDYCVDEAVQIHGGNGFSAEYPVERCYRDSRITRIYEGTNEINRIFAIGLIIKRTLAGKIRMKGVEETQEASPLPTLRQLVINLKKASQLVIKAAFDTLGNQLRYTQQVAMNLSDIVLDVYLAESVLLRTEKLINDKGKDAAAQQLAMTQVFIYDVADRIAKKGKDAIGSFASEAVGRELYGDFQKLTKMNLMDVGKLRREISGQLTSD